MLRSTECGPGVNRAVGDGDVPAVAGGSAPDTLAPPCSPMLAETVEPHGPQLMSVDESV